jgi:hypothetical protein
MEMKDIWLAGWSLRYCAAMEKTADSLARIGGFHILVAGTGFEPVTFGL